MKNKVSGQLSDFSLIKTEGTRITIGYELKKASGDMYEWYEVYIPKKQISQFTFETVKNAVLADINSQTDEKIISGMVWTPQAGGDPIPVWLSTENQFNFKSAYDLAVQSNGATLPVTFKMGEDADGNPIYHTFETMEDANDFYFQAVDFVHTTLEQGWDRKDSIDWQPYEDYFNNNNETEL